MRLDRIGLPVVLAIAFAAILVATMATGWQIARDYEALFHAAKTEQTQRLLDIEIGARLWRDQFALAAAAGRAIAGRGELTEALAARDFDRIAQLLDDEFRRGAGSNGQLAVQGITIYDAEFHPLSERWRGDPAPVAPEIVAKAAERTGGARLRSAQFAWLYQGEPRVTVFVAAGLRPTGYFGLHIDPLPALAELDERIGMTVTISSKGDRRLLYSPGNLQLVPDADVRRHALRLNGPRGEHLADIEVTEDVSGLIGALAAARHDWMLIWVVIVAGVAAASLTVVHFFLRQVRRREQDNEQRFRDYAETASDWFWESGPDHRFTYLSERARAFGIDPSKRLGVSRVSFAADTAEEPEKWREHLATLERHEAFRDFVYQRTGSDGVSRHVAVSGKPVFDADGTFRGYRGSSRDVTAQLAAEQQLRTAKAEAEALRDDALGADRAKSEFLATMSHELRTPLNAVIGFSEAMMREVMGPVGNERYREYIADIHNSGQHLLELINAILDLSKLQARSMTLHEDVVDVGAVVGACVRLVKERARKASIELTTALPAELLLVRADELRLKQILLNLLSNAMKFTPDAGKVTVAASRDAAGRTEIVVADTGIGLTEEEIRIALEPFRQIDSSLGRKQEGTGLGLPLTKALVDLHGGELHIDSEPVRGTRVTIRLPAERAVSISDALKVAG